MNKVSSIKDNIISDYLKGAVRRIIDVNQEIVNISFYNKLIKEKSLCLKILRHALIR